MTAAETPTPAPAAAGWGVLRGAGDHPIVRDFPQGAVIIFDADLRYVAAGGMGLADVGLSRELLEGHTIGQVFPPEVVAAIEPSYRAALRGEESTMDVDYAGRVYEQRLSALRAADGTIIAGMGFTQDVTEARGVQQALEASERSLRQEHRRLAEAQDLGRVGSWEWDLTSDQLVWSKALLGLYGLTAGDFAGTYTSALDVVDPADRTAVDAATKVWLAGGERTVRYRVARVDTGELRWFDARGRLVHDDDVPVRLVGAVVEVTEQVQAERDARDKQSFYTAVLAASPDVTLVTDLRDGRVTYASREAVLGLSRQDLTALTAQDLLALVHPEDVLRLRATDVAAGALADGEVLQLRYRAKHTDGSWRWMNRRVTPFARTENGTVVQVLSVVRDVTDVVLAEERLTRAALHDPLTALPNRSLLLDRLDAALARAAREGQVLSVLFVDLDDFKGVNDTYGHAAGDAVLVDMARRLSAVLRDGDTVARIGGDEFVVLVEPWNRQQSRRTHSPQEDRSVGREVADRIAVALRRPFILGETQQRLTASIGITVTSLPGAGQHIAVTAEQVLNDADAAMYRAKALGKDRTAVHDPDTRAYAAVCACPITGVTRRRGRAASRTMSGAFRQPPGPYQASTENGMNGREHARPGRLLISGSLMGSFLLPAHTDGAA